MESVWSNKIDEVLKVGHPLTEIGLRNWALTKSQALFAIERFLEYNIPVLGGDICENTDGLIKPNYDSWYCDPSPGETESEFLNRSIVKAKQYIEAYPIKKTDTIFFVLVPRV